MRPEVRVMHDSIEFVERVLVDLDAAKETIAACDTEWMMKLSKVEEENRMLRRQFDDLFQKYKAIDPSSIDATVRGLRQEIEILKAEKEGLAKRLLKAKEYITGALG